MIIFSNNLYISVWICHIYLIQRFCIRHQGNFLGHYEAMGEQRLYMLMYMEALYKSLLHELKACG